MIVSKTVLCASIIAACGMLMLTACDKTAPSNNTPAAKTSTDGRCPHEIKADKCPFCTPSLVESAGFCGAHGVAEALCYQCRPYLKTAFKAKGDWCKEHDAPESQCMVCHPELKEKINAGEHGS